MFTRFLLIAENPDKAIALIEENIKKIRDSLSVIDEGITEEEEEIRVYLEALNQNYYALNSSGKDSGVYNFSEYKNILYTVEKLEEHIITRKEALERLKKFKNHHQKEIEEAYERIKKIKQKYKEDARKVVNLDVYRATRNKPNN